MINDEKLWNYLLDGAPPNSALMGGAVIDYWFGKTAKDFDIFYSYKFGQELNLPKNWKMTDVDFNDPVWIKEHGEWYLQGVGENGVNPISSVLEYLVDGEHKVQLIGVMYANPAKHFMNFDHSLTLGRYTKAGLFIHRKALQSFDDHIVEYVCKNKTQEAKARSLIRAQKKTARYGGHWSYKGFA